MRIIDQMAAFLFRHNLRGSTRFHTLVCRRRRLQLKTKHGIGLQLDPGEYIDAIVLRHGYYEEEVLDAIRVHLGPGEVFWDVGSNLGLHALTIAHARRDARVYAFEPNPQMAGLIQAAAAANGVAVAVQEVALDTRTGRAKFFVYAGNVGRSGLHNWDADPHLASIEVATLRGDEAVGNGAIRQPHVVKLDVEGNEAQVLEGMPAVLADRALHTIVFEDSPTEETATKAILRASGFQFSRLARREPTQHNLENFVARRPR